MKRQKHTRAECKKIASAGLMSVSKTERRKLKIQNNILFNIHALVLAYTVCRVCIRFVYHNDIIVCLSFSQRLPQIEWWPLVHTHLAFVAAVCGDFKSTETHAICFLVLIRILFFSVCSLFIYLFFFKCIRSESLENQMFDLNFVDVKHNDAHFVYIHIRNESSVGAKEFSLVGK